jgi:hypothetical protein
MVLPTVPPVFEPDKKISHSSGSSLSNAPVVLTGRGFVAESNEMHAGSIFLRIAVKG